MKNYSKISVFLFIICAFGADVKIVSVKEGDSLTLNTGLRGQFHILEWKFGDSDSLLTESFGNEASYTDDERFRDRLKLNHQTGSLTINNMRITDSGFYHLMMHHHNYGLLFKTFIVTVHGVFDEDGVKRESVMEGDSVTLDTLLREKFNRIKWRFEVSGSIIAEIDSNEISYPLNDTERFRDRLKLNNQTGSLTIKNIRITDSGVYEIEIDHDTWNPYEIFKIAVCGPFPPDPDLDLSPDAVTQIVFVVLLPVLAVAAAVSAVLYCRRNISKRRRQNPAAEEPNTRNSTLLHMVPEEKMQMNFRDSAVE